MSGILTNIAKYAGKISRYKKGIAAISAVLAIVFEVYLLLWGRTFLALFICFLLCVAILNFFIAKKMKLCVLPFMADSKIRNVDYLIIGELCADFIQLPEGSTKICLTAPDRSLYSAYEILRHTFGILKARGGTVIIVVYEKNLSIKKYTIFDVPVFKLSPTSINRLKLKKKEYEAYIPILISPVKAVKFLAGHGSKRQMSKRIQVECPVNEIQRFCEERDIRLIVEVI